MRRVSRAGARWLLSLGMLVAGPSARERARAAGVEDTVTGAVALGRSANYVRANDYMAVWQNPANLSLVNQRDLGLELRIPFFRGCFDRTPDPALVGAPDGYLPTESFDEVCNDGGPTPAGGGGFAMALPKGFGFGVGIFSPGGTPHTKFGSSAINTIAPSATDAVPPTTFARESPNRYLLLERTVLAAFLMAGVGYQPNRYLRFGLSGGGGAVDIKYKNVTSLTSAFNDQEVLADVRVLDAFVPRVTLSAVASPIESLDLMASFTWTDDIEASGTLDVTANGYTKAPRGDCSSPTPGPHCRVDDAKLTVPFQRFEVVLGARYAMLRRGRERALDPMRDELFDVELDALWSQTSRVDAYVLDIHDGVKDPQRIQINAGADALPLSLPHQASLFHGWRDTYAVRLGGDWNVLAERLALRLGLGYESAGVDKKNLTLDYWPVMKTTVSLGATVAIDRWRLSVGYAHVFHKSQTVGLGEGNVREVIALPMQSRVVNEGRYTAGLDVLSLQANVRF